MRDSIPEKYFEEGKTYDARGIRFAWFFDRLPMQFETPEALEIAKELEIPERTARYWLSKDKGIERVSHGMYRKKRKEYHD